MSHCYLNTTTVTLLLSHCYCHTATVALTLKAVHFLGNFRPKYCYMVILDKVIIEYNQLKPLQLVYEPTLEGPKVQSTWPGYCHWPLCGRASCSHIESHLFRHTFAALLLLSMSAGLAKTNYWQMRGASLESGWIDIALLGKPSHRRLDRAALLVTDLPRTKSTTWQNSLTWNPLFALP